MKTTLEFQLPLETEELRAAIQPLAWKRCLESVAERVVAWRCGKPIEFPGRELEEEVGRNATGFGFFACGNGSGRLEFRAIKGGRRRKRQQTGRALQP